MIKFVAQFEFGYDIDEIERIDRLQQFVMFACLQLPQIIRPPIAPYHDSRLTHRVGLDIRPGFVAQDNPFFKGEKEAGKPIRHALSTHLKYSFQFRAYETEKAIGGEIAFVLDDSVITRPTVNARIESGAFQISALRGCDLKSIRFDWAMKCMLRDKANFAVLEGLMTTLLDEKITIHRLLESESNQEDEYDKYNRVDLLAENTKGELILFEIQNNNEFAYFQRMLLGTSKLVTEYIRRGKGYENVRKVYSINIV